MVSEDLVLPMLYSSPRVASVVMSTEAALAWVLYPAGEGMRPHSCSQNADRSVLRPTKHCAEA